jgi:two-component system, OmpR family, phosphate regulon sensor histidine kinase PhoR
MLDGFLIKRRAPTDRSRAVFILIALAGVLPSALVLWFASLAIRSEQLATTQIEEEAHQVLLSQIKSDLVQRWNTLLGETDQRVASLSPEAAFYEAVTESGADGLIVLAGDSHRVAYPGLPRRAEEANPQLASQLAVLTAAIQRGDKSGVEHAAQAILGNPAFERCVDRNGRHTLSSIELLILEHQEVVSDAIHASAFSRLTKRLNDYGFDLIPASQRRFLMSRLSALSSQTSTPAPLFPTMPAEFLSAQFLESNQELVAGPDLTRSPIEGVWQQRLPSGHGIVLFTGERIRKLSADWLAAMDSPLATRVRMEVVSDNNTHQSAGTEMLLGSAFPGWRLRIVGADVDTRGASVKGIYVALSVASVGLILLILLVMASMTLRRLALAQQKNTMVATVSHELKTPVSSIKLLVDTLLQDSELRPDRVREYLNLIARENSRLSQLVENVLSFSRIERTRFRIEKQPLDIAALIREAVATFMQQAEITDREIAVEIAPDIPPYRGDAWALNRVLLNLLDNACKFSDPPREIRVSARVEKQSLVISVSDRGIGIREADFEKIFDQFYQADQKLSRSNEGCGLGLGIVKHIVKLHDGTIEVKSELGSGSTFTIRLPLAQP